MNDFDSDIKNLRPISWHEIEWHYVQLLENAVALLLQKMGYEENQEFWFDGPKKRKSRLSFRTDSVLSIRYNSHPSSSDKNFPFHREYEFLIRYKTDDAKFPENIMVIPPTFPGVDFWCDIYNYLRIEAKSVKKSKRSKIDL